MKKLSLIIIAVVLCCIVGCGKKSPLDIAVNKNIKHIPLAADRTGLIVSEDFEKCNNSLPSNFVDTGTDNMWEIKKIDNDTVASQSAISSSIVSAYYNSDVWNIDKNKDYTVEARVQVEEMVKVISDNSLAGIFARFDTTSGGFWSTYLAYYSSAPYSNHPVNEVPGWDGPGFYQTIFEREQEDSELARVLKMKKIADAVEPGKWYVITIGVKGYNPTHLRAVCYKDGTNPEKAKASDIISVIEANSNLPLKKGYPGLRQWQTKMAYSYFYVYSYSNKIDNNDNE